MQERMLVMGIVLDEGVTFSLSEVCRSCGITAEVVIEMVDEGVVEPLGTDPVTWRFPGDALRRMQTVLRLTHDLRVNLAGAALALQLLDEREALQRELRHMSGGYGMEGAME